MFCKYKYFFGRPNTGIHAYRLGGIAIVDLLLTIAAAYTVSKVSKYSFPFVLVVLLGAGIVMHALFCVPTAGNLWIQSHLF